MLPVSEPFFVDLLPVLSASSVTEVDPYLPVDLDESLPPAEALYCCGAPVDRECSIVALIGSVIEVFRPRVYFK